MSKENLLKSFDEKKNSELKLEEEAQDQDQQENEVCSIKEESVETELFENQEENAPEPHDSIDYLKDFHVGPFLQNADEIVHFPVFQQ